MTVTTTDTEAAQLFANHATETRFEDLSVDVVERTKHCILDTIGVAIAGSGTPDITAIHKIVTDWGGRAASTVFGFGDKLPPYTAVLANAAMAHQYDFDDTHDTAVCHPTAATLTAALAMGESVGGVSGKDLITAVACGNDLVTRLGLAIDGTLWDFPWVRAPVIGIFGATLSAGIILGLDKVQLRNALGFALPQAAGTLECLRGEESAVRGMRDGLIYKDAILAVSLAAAGLRGDQAVFDGAYGLFRAYFGGRYDRSRLLHRLGDQYEGINVSLKPWPSCRHTHATLTALFDVLEREDVEGTSVRRVVVHVGDGNERLCQPPGGEYGGRMALLCNIPFAVSVALAHGAFPLSAFSEEGFSDPAVRTALAKVRCVHDEAQNRLGTIEPGHVEVELATGAVIEGRTDLALGHPNRPMSRHDVAAKVRLAVEAAVTPFTVDQIESLIDAVFSCEMVDDVAGIAALTVPAAR